MEKKVSEQIKSFLDFVDECRELNSMAYSGVGEEDRRHQDLITRSSLRMTRMRLPGSA